MPRQRQPDINIEDLVKEQVGQAAQRTVRNRKKNEEPHAEILRQGDVTKRPMLPIESEVFFNPESSTPEMGALGASSTPGGLRKQVKEMVGRVKRPFRSPDDEFPEDEKIKVWFQSHEIKTSNHPASCICGKGNKVCGTQQTKDGETSRLPVGISKKEEDEWLGSEAEKRNISPETMRSWHEEQKTPSPIEIPPTNTPEDTHSLLNQFDHDPGELCHENGRNPIGHVVTVWNHDGGLPGFPKGALNLGIVVGIAPRGFSDKKKSLSPEIIDAHNKICGANSTTHEEGCPVGFHDKNCRGGEHAKGCQIPENTITDGAHEDETLYKVLPWTATPIDEVQKRHRSKIDWSSISSPEPELRATGLRGLAGGTVVPASRCVHVPNSAMQSFLFNRDTESKVKIEKGPLVEEGYAGSKPVKLRMPKFFTNPLSHRQHAQNRTLPGYGFIMDQLEKGKTDLEEAPKFVRGERPPKPRSEEENMMDDLIGNKEASSRKAYTHVNEPFLQTPSCRFCEDASYKEGKGPIVQTSVAPDGRPLYAHEECDNPFSFAERFKFETEFDGPNPVDVDFISLGSYNWGMGNQPGARRVNKQLGISTPSTPSRLVDPGIPGNKKRIDSMGLPEHKAAESEGDEVDSISETQVSNLNSNGTAKPPR
jgi:hypothetical protein